MKMSNGGCGICYNVQIAVDSRHYLVVAVGVVSDPDDKQQLSHMAEMAKEELNVEGLTVLTDAGCYTASEFAACIDMGITPLVSKPVNKKSAVSDKYSKSKFRYDTEKDACICPQGQVLCGKVRRASSKTPGTRYNNPNAFRHCPKKTLCTNDPYRNIYDRPFQRYAALQATAGVGGASIRNG